MTSAHVVNVAVTKIKGVASVDVSLNRALATIKLKPGNDIALSKLAQSIREKGYTIPAAEILVSGTLARVQNRWLLRIPTSGETLELAENPSTSDLLAKRAGDEITIRAKTSLAKDRKPSPLTILELK